MEEANLAAFLKFGKAKNQKFVLSLPKNHGWPRNWGAWSKTGGLCPPSPGLKPPVVTTVYFEAYLYHIKIILAT